jgi:hypothetical protein
MAFDFPSSPTVGQQFTPVAGTTYTWNGQGWVLSGNAFVPAPGGRLTLLSGFPVLTNDQVNSTIFYTPYIHDQIPIYNGTAWTSQTFPETSLTLDTTNAPASQLFDIFGFLDSGTFRIGYGPNWSVGGGSNAQGTSVRGSGAGSTAIQRLNGRWVNTNAITLRYNSTTVQVAQALQATYLGTFYTSSAGSTSMIMKPAAGAGGSACRLYLYNAYNRVTMRALSRNNNAAYTPVTAGVWLRFNNSGNSSIYFVDGLFESVVHADAVSTGYCNTANAAANVGTYATSIELNWSGSNVQGVTTVGVEYVANWANITVTPSCSTDLGPALGLNSVDPLEYYNVGGAATVLVYPTAWNAQITAGQFLRVSMMM